MSGSLDICLFSTSSVRGCAFHGVVDHKFPGQECLETDMSKCFKNLYASELDVEVENKR